MTKPLGRQPCLFDLMQAISEKGRNYVLLVALAIAVLMRERLIEKVGWEDYSSRVLVTGVGVGWSLVADETWVRQEMRRNR